MPDQPQACCRFQDIDQSQEQFKTSGVQPFEVMPNL